MKNIWEIFRRDIKRIKNNVIAMIVIMGITVVPCLYAWFNIAASWDPYKNTGNLKVAVASVDKGYEGSLIPLELNMGDQVLTSLRSNSQLDWVFTSKKKAVSGVKSGKYYAAIVIPENFSTDMMSLFSENISKPSITYYSNAKENAIAPKVTDKGASAIQRQVNEVFIETISDTVITSFKAVTNVADQNGVESIAGNLANNLDQIGSDLNVASATLSSFDGSNAISRAVSSRSLSSLRKFPVSKLSPVHLDLISNNTRAIASFILLLFEAGNFRWIFNALLSIGKRSIL